MDLLLKNGNPTKSLTLKRTKVKQHNSNILGSKGKYDCILYQEDNFDQIIFG